MNRLKTRSGSTILTRFAHHRKPPPRHIWVLVMLPVVAKMVEGDQRQPSRKVIAPRPVLVDMRLHAPMVISRAVWKVGAEVEELD